MGSSRRRAILLVLALVFVLLIVAFPLVASSAAHQATTHQKALRLFALVSYTLVIIVDLGAMALVAAREIRGIFDDYRAQRHDAIDNLVTTFGKPRGRGDGSNGKPLE